MMMLQPPAGSDGDVLTPPVILVGEERWRFPVEQAIDAVGGRLLATLGWAAVADDLSHHAACAVLIVETGGTGIDRLASALPRIDAFAAALDIPVVVALEEEAIDVVAATMLTASVQLLCAPTASDRVGALAIAIAQRGAMLVSDRVSEGEAARLHRLNEEVARIAETLARLTRRDAEDRNAAIVADHPTPFRHRQQSDVVIDAAEVRRAIRGRRLRDQHFGSGLFEDPAWDVLLDLFAAELEGAQVSVSSLCIAASVAPTTALRWIAKLTDSGLLERRPDPFDRRRAFMELSPFAAQAMREHVAALRRAGLPFG